ncbi:hypothetical protein GCM10008959_07560 [Deinococcus seoulensis]|uniref:Uncharacterized protein n=1 Tax=Deinococcus seoulensis TaxID=1837379 RepID=A0ABQ2RR49_9DEIO|nr:hypothetical protein [Deinococcus seoulensis]GGR48879.1 hypothetical protein GCM10008959_07560 [Deinococcus seoulensis]
MMIYERLPRPDGLQLTREQLRVYMMCNGRRALEEVAALTRLPLNELQSALKDLQQLNLLAPAAAPAAPAAPLPAQLQEQLMQEAQAALNALPDDALPTPAMAPATAPATTAPEPALPHTLPDIITYLQGVLTEHLGGRAAPHAAKLSACRDLTELGALVPKMVVKIKLTIHEQAGTALKDAFAQCMTAHAAQEAARA